MSMFKTELTTDRIKLDSWITKLYGLESGSFLKDNNMTLDEWLKQYNGRHTNFDSQLGTIGGGNHFAELQQIEQVVDQKLFQESNIDVNNLYLLVHSGSRGYGHEIIGEHERQFGKKGVHQDTSVCSNYLKLHDNACNWAKTNRHLIARKFLQCLSTKRTLILDVWHNNVTKKTFFNPENENETEELWLHRKGAAPTEQGLIIIPGSRGTLSYLVSLVNSLKILQSPAYFAAHGAGRRWTKSKALAMISNNRSMTPSSLAVTDIGSRVICEDKQLIYEEHPYAYKDIDEVIKDLETFGIVKVVAILKPLITHKTRSVKSK
jgi:release factor H-coupled RctB family protein